jgi:hypothetical protein
MTGLGRTLFVAILLLIAGTLNVIYGIAGVSNAHFFNNTQYVFSSLHTWGWITIVVGCIQLVAGSSLASGRTFGRVIGIIAASIGALESLLSVGGAHPWWSLAIFAVCLWILHGLVAFGSRPERAGDQGSCPRHSGRGFGAISVARPECLMLVSPRAKTNATALAIGYVIGLADPGGLELPLTPSG